jgi:hypothetical protein
MNTFRFLATLLALAAFTLLGCGNNDVYTDGINWNGDSAGTLELVNGSNKDMIMFLGQIPAQSTIIGGVKAGVTTRFDICKHVSDCNEGGWSVLRGVTKEQYDMHGTDARVEYSSMISYRRDARYRFNINPNYMGDFGFQVTNNANIGIELRKDSPDGEKIAYLGRLQNNQMVYASSTNAINIYPVYVYFNGITKEVTSLSATSVFASTQVNPASLIGGNIPNLYFPTVGYTWEDIVNGLKSPTAYIKIQNNVNNGGYVTLSTSTRLISQDGIDGINAGETSTFEVKAIDEEDGGIGLNIEMVYYQGAIRVPVRYSQTDIDEGRGNNNINDHPIIWNQYNYTVSVGLKTGGNPQDPLDYNAQLVRGTKRDLSHLIQ